MSAPKLVVQFFCIVFLGLLSHSTFADEASDLREEISAITAKQDAAYSSKDVVGFTAFCAAEYQASDEEGNHWDLQDEKKHLKSMFAAIQSLQQKSTLRQCRGKGSQALVLVKIHREIVWDKPEMMRGHTMGEDETVRQLWVKTAAGWRLRQGQSLSRASTLFGKSSPYDMSSSIRQEAKSPDGKNVAVLAYRDGLTYGYQYLTLQPVSGWHRKDDERVTQEGLTKVTEMASEGLMGIA